MSQPVCVLGLGLIGGSLLRAARAAGIPAWGYNRSAVACAAARVAGFDASPDLSAVLARAAAEDALIVIAVPMPAVSLMLEAVAANAPGCSLTDVVSVKEPMVQAIQEHGLASRYVGGHPMAGTSSSGWEASDATLFAGAAWVVAADDGADPQVWTAVARLALACGSVVVPAGSSEHDRAVARISHLPHVLSEALAVAGAAGGELALGLAAGSFHDGTRVAGTAPALVRAMCEANADALGAVLDESLALLSAARDSLRQQQSMEALATAGHAAHAVYQQHQRREISGITPGAPGWLAQLRDAGRHGGVLTHLA